MNELLTASTTLSALLKPVAFDDTPAGEGGEGTSAASPPADGGDLSTAIGGGDDAKKQADEAAKKEPEGDGEDGKEDPDGKKPEGDGDAPKKETETDQGDKPLELQAPEGFENFQEDFDKFAEDMSPWLKENPEATARDVLAEAASRQAKLVADQTKQQLEDFDKQVDDWLNEAKADKEIGGDNFDQNIAIAGKAIEAFGDDTLKELLDKSGFGNHPSFIKAFYNAGKQLSEAPVLKGAEAAAEMSLADAITPKNTT